MDDRIIQMPLLESMRAAFLILNSINFMHPTPATQTDISLMHPSTVAVHK